MKTIKPKKEKRLNKKEIDFIRVIYETTAKTNSQIAREFNIFEGAIRYLAKKHNWKKTNELQAYYEAEKIATKQKILDKFKSEQKQEELKQIKSLADKEGEELAKEELRAQRARQEMIANAYEMATKIISQANDILSKRTNQERRTEDIIYQGVKTGENKKTIIEKDFTAHDLEKLFNIARPLLETDGFLHKPIVELQNNIQNNVNITKNIDNDFEQFSEIAIENGAKKAETLQLASQVYNNIKDV